MLPTNEQIVIESLPESGHFAILGAMFPSSLLGGGTRCDDNTDVDSD